MLKAVVYVCNVCVKELWGCTKSGKMTLRAAYSKGHRVHGHVRPDQPIDHSQVYGESRPQGRYVLPRY